MTVVTLSCGKNGVLKCEANGHADFSKKGTDIVCAAITILIRTTMQVLSHTDDVFLTADTSTRGNLAFTAEAKAENPETEIRLEYAADFIRNGIKSLEKEFSGNVKFLEIQISGK